MSSTTGSELIRIKASFEANPVSWSSQDLSCKNIATDTFLRMEEIVTNWLRDLNQASEPARRRLQTNLSDSEFTRVALEYQDCLALSSPIEKAFRTFTDQLLSSFPDVPINYGKPCVSMPRKWTHKEIQQKGIQQKGIQFCENYPKIQEIRGDGNCFYTAFTVLYLESLRKNCCALEAFTAKVIETPIEYQETLLQLLVHLKESPLELTQLLQDNSVVLSLIHFFRNLIDSSIKTTPAFLNRAVIARDALDGGNPIESFIKNHILSMGVEADQLQIQLLCEILDFPITIYYANTHQELTIETSTKQVPRPERLCLDGAHYFILHPSDKLENDFLKALSINPSPGPVDSTSEVDATSFMNPSPGPVDSTSSINPSPGPVDSTSSLGRFFNLFEPVSYRASLLVLIMSLIMAKVNPFD